MDQRYVREVTDTVHKNLEGFRYLAKHGDSNSKPWASVFLQIAGVERS
jgi:hypothetical protein